MNTTINKSFEVHSGVGRVWQFLSDPAEVVTCVPGASITEKIDDTHYRGMVSFKLGPVKAKYNGQIEIDELDDANHVMRLTGKGSEMKGKGNAEMKMTAKVDETGDGSSIDFQMDLIVTGKLAQFGARLIEDVTNELVNQFVENFKSKLAETENADESAEQAETVETGQTEPEVAADSSSEGASLNALGLLWKVIVNAVKRLFN